MALNDVMEFDHVVTVHADGTVTDGPANLYAPDLYGNYHGDTDGEWLSCMLNQDWQLITRGYSGQHGYNGPVMHNSEFIGGGLERDILARPGHYVAIVCQWLPEAGGDEDADSIEGWAVAFLPSAETPE